MTDDLATFCRVAYGSVGGLIGACAIDRASGHAHETIFKSGDVAGIARWIAAQGDGGTDAYLCAHLLTSGRRVKTNAAPLTCLYADGDKAPIPTGDLAPAMVVRTSPGRWHGYWPLSRPLEPATAESLNKRLTHTIGADKGGFDLTQLLRPPGSRNHKYPDAPMVTLESCDESRVFDPDDLDKLLPPLPTATPTATPKTTTDDDTEPPVRLSDYGLAVWRGDAPTTQANHSGVIDQSETLYHLGCLLAEGGATRTTIADALAERDASWGWDRYTERPAEYDRIANKALDKIATAPTAPTGTTATTGTGKRFERVDLATRDMQPVDWLVPGLIAKRALNLMSGRPGIGKSVVLCDVTARGSRGLPMPGQAATTARVLRVMFLTAEDDIDTTILPRLVAAGADLDNVFVYQMKLGDGSDDLPTIPDDLPMFAEIVRRDRIDLAILDPIMSFVNGKTDSHNDHAVKRALSPVAHFAAETGTAVVGSVHENKNVQLADALYRISGAVAIGSTARVVSYFGLANPDDESDTSRLWIPAKNNVDKRYPGLTLALADAVATHRGRKVPSVRAHWTGTTGQTANQAMAASKPKTVKDDIHAWVKDYLTAHGETESDALKDAAEDAGFSRSYVSQVLAAEGRKELPAFCKRKGTGKGAPWSWYAKTWRVIDGNFEPVSPDTKSYQSLSKLSELPVTLTNSDNSDRQTA